jgi:hypothetical protein
VARVAGSWLVSVAEHRAGLRVDLSAFVSHYGGKRRQDWTTPRAMFDALDADYGFTLDGASASFVTRRGRG